MSNSRDKKIFSKAVARTKSRLETNLTAACYFTAICTVGMASTAYADWFQVANIKANLITPIYTLIKDNLGFIAFSIGGAATFLARGQDMWQKATAFGIGSLGTAGAVKLAETVLNLT